MKQDFVQQINNTIHEVMDEIHTAMPGKIAGYANGLVKVKPSIKYKTPKGEYIDYPIIENVPLVVPHSGDTVIAVPVKAGDDCLIIIAEQSLDAWIAGAEDDTQLKFDLTNAICIPGLTKTDLSAQQEANSKGCIVMSGDVMIKGNLTCTGIVKGSNI